MKTAEEWADEWVLGYTCEVSDIHRFISDVQDDALASVDADYEDFWDKDDGKAALSKAGGRTIWRKATMMERTRLIDLVTKRVKQIERSNGRETVASATAREILRLVSGDV